MNRSYDELLMVEEGLKKNIKENHELIRDFDQNLIVFRTEHRKLMTENTELKKKFTVVMKESFKTAVKVMAKKVLGDDYRSEDYDY